MPSQYLLAMRINLAMKYGGHAGTLEAQVKAAYAREKGCESQGVCTGGIAGSFR